MRAYFLIVILCVSLPASAADKMLLVLGDSISAGYGIALNRGWVHLLQARLNQQGYRYRVNNASISGDTTAGARARLTGLLKVQRPDISIIELGGNDGLRGLSLEAMSTNLAAIIHALLRQGSKVLLVAMRLPPNYGQVYNDRFEAVYRALAASCDIVLAKFILHGIAGKAGLMQSDGLHPLAEAQELMLDNVWSSLQPLLEKDANNRKFSK